MLLFVGPLAQRLRDHVTPGRDTGRDDEVAPSDRRRRQLARRAHSARRAGLPRDIASPTFDYHGEREQIPRRDLPFGTLRWQGSSGDRAQRPTRSGSPSFDYYKVSMPAWAASLGATPLSPSEAAAADVLKNL